MAVTTPMNAKPAPWTDGRLDEFAADVGRRFDEVDRRFDEVDRRFDRLEAHMESGFNRLSDRLDDTLKMLFGGVAALFGVLLAGVFTLIATQL